MSRKRILFIDSDDGFVREVATSLHRRGFDAVLASSSTDGVERARQDRPDLIVVNVELAPTNGWSVCTKLKKDDELKGIPIVLTSSTSTVDTFEKHKKLKTRADEYLLKPYESSDLIRLAGTLVGMPDVPEQEDVVVEDETLSSGDFDMSGLDEEIPVADDEPINGHVNGSTVLEASVAEALLDPLEGGSLGSEPLADEPFADEPLAEEPLGGEPLSDEAVNDEGLETSDETVIAPAPDQGGAEDDLLAFDQNFANLAPPATEAAPAEDNLVEFADDQLVSVADETAADPLAAEPLGESSLSDEIAFDEAPLESPSEETVVAEAPVESSLPADGFSAPAAPPFDDSRVAALETRVAELEAEIEGYRATENNRDQELERVRAEAARKDQETDELRAQLLQRDKAIRDLKESESRSKAELAKVADERTRREAATKALTQRAEQITAQARKFEREAAAAREDAKGIPALKDRIAELEQAQRDAQAETAAVREQLDALQREHDSVKTAHEQAATELESARTENTGLTGQLTEARQAAEGHREELEKAKAESADLRQELDQAKTEAEQATASAIKAREEAASAESASAQAKLQAEESARSAESIRADAEKTQRELDESREAAKNAQAEAEKARAEAEALRAQVAAAEERVATLTAQAQTANERAAKAREALRQAVEHLTHEPG